MSTSLAPTTALEPTPTDRLVERIYAARLAADGQYVISQDRFVDALLDIWNLCPTDRLRGLVGDALAEVRFQSCVVGSHAGAALDELLGAVLVEDALTGVDIVTVFMDLRKAQLPT